MTVYDKPNSAGEQAAIMEALDDALDRAGIGQHDVSTRYEQGRGFAYRVSRKLAADGYVVIRSAGSKTKVDIVAFKQGQLLFIQAKKATDGYLLPGEHQRLLYLAGLVGALPLVVYKPDGRRGFGYRRLTGPGSKDWQPWTPDQVGTP